MINRLRDMNQTLPKLMIGILIHGSFGSLVSLFFLAKIEEKSDYFLGLFVGIVIALLMAIHMAWSLERAVEFHQESAAMYMKRHNLIRYGVLVIALFLIMISGFINPLIVFFGIMGLKTGAYLVPLIDKGIVFFKKK